MTGSLAESPTGQPRRGALYVVSTPIGNLDDITVRALNTLKSVGLVAAEDTRRTGLLLRHFGIGTPVTSLHEHNEQQKIPALLHKLAEGTDVALVSDAGTPLVADPGQRLIASVVAQRLRVIPVPGASAVLAAIVASGYPATEFVFAGFAPARSKDRIDWLKRLADDERTIVFFEAPHRIEKTVAVMAELLGNRPIVLARELTKLHEEITHTTAQGLIGTRITQRGEFTVVLGPYSKPKDSIMSVDDVELNSYFCQLTDSTHISRRDAVAATAVHFGLSPNDVYERLERIKRSGPP